MMMIFATILLVVGMVMMFVKHLARIGLKSILPIEEEWG